MILLNVEIYLVKENEFQSYYGISFSDTVCHIIPCPIYSNTTLFIHHRDIINKLPCLTCSKHPCQTLDNTRQGISCSDHIQTTIYEHFHWLINSINILCSTSKYCIYPYLYVWGELTIAHFYRQCVYNDSLSSQGYGNNESVRKRTFCGS